MEQTKQVQTEPTKANSPIYPSVFSRIDEREFLIYQRNKRICEAKRAMTKTQASVFHGEDLQSVCQRAVRLHQAAVRLPLSKLSSAHYYLQNTGIALDCVAGGDGETLTKVKVYEAKLAVRRHADEITLPIAPSLLDTCRFGEIRKEVVKVKRAVGKAILKVHVNKTSSPTTLSRVARLASEAGARYFSVPYFDGCERLRTHLIGKCALEITQVSNLEDFKKLICAGVERIDTKQGVELYMQLLQEINQMENEHSRYEMKQEDTQKSTKIEEREEIADKEEGDRCEMKSETGAPCTDLKQDKNPCKNEETNYFCRIENGELKFL